MLGSPSGRLRLRWESRSLGVEDANFLYQDCMEYANYEKYNNSPVDGFILQGSVSDREGLAPLMDRAKMKESLDFASRLINDGKGDHIMPKDRLPEMLTTPITAYRWHSLAAVG